MPRSTRSSGQCPPTTCRDRDLDLDCVCAMQRLAISPRVRTIGMASNSKTIQCLGVVLDLLTRCMMTVTTCVPQSLRCHVSVCPCPGSTLNIYAAFHGSYLSGAQTQWSHVMRAGFGFFLESDPSSST